MRAVNFRLLSIAVLCVIASACAHVSPPYSASATNVEEIKQVSSGSMSKVSVGNFTADKDVQASITCRGEGPVSAPDKTFEQFIKDALVEELKIAKIFDEASARKLTATLNKIDFSSAMSGGRWDIEMTFSAKSVDPFVVSITYPFESSYIAATACQQVAQALPLATQKLINELIKHPSFKKVIRSSI
jgi:hypothetical protein